MASPIFMPHDHARTPALVRAARFPGLRSLAWSGDQLYASRGYQLLRSSIVDISSDVAWKPVAAFRPTWRPPTHILNGFIWAAWGVYDYFPATNDRFAHELFSRAVQTLLHNLDRYDLGFWSLYEQSGTRLPMVASPFYHQLHIVQLRVMHRLTGEDTLARVADR